jgi:competence protein ComEA
LDELSLLPGIGDVKGQAIIDYREANGPFVVIEQIQNVLGIGPATFEKIKDLITIDSSP